MKKIIVSSLAALALSYFNYNLSAATKSNGADDPAGHDSGDDNGGDRPGHHLGETNEIEGHELFHGHIVVLPTTNAPANVRGSAEIEQEDEEGTVFYKVQVQTFGLIAGTYPVTAVLISDGSTISLGDLSASGARSARADLLLPSGVSASDIGQIIVSDSGGNPILIGDATSSTPGTVCSFRGSVRITPGPAAPSAKGKAAIKVDRRRSRSVERFTLVASKLPPNATFDIVVDGTQLGTATSNKRGGLVIRHLEAELLNVHTVSLLSSTDATEAASAHF